MFFFFWQNANKTLLFFKQIIQANGGTVDSALSRCTHLLCESQVSNTYLQVSIKACFEKKHTLYIIPAVCYTAWFNWWEYFLNVMGLFLGYSQS